MNEAKFEIKKFNSGEYEVRLMNKLYTWEPIIIEFNWFKTPDIFVLKLMVDAIKSTTGVITPKIILKCNYLPYSRQDRIFEAGQGVPLITVLDFIGTCNVDEVQVMALHSQPKHRTRFNIFVKWLSLREKDYKDNKVISVFPDVNAINHFCLKDERTDDDVLLTFKKERDATLGKVKLERDDDNSTFYGFEDGGGDFMIYDDICDGGRTFVECAKILKNDLYADNIELTVYHAFLTHGIKELMESGITKIHIINPDSYNYVCNKFPDNKDYFVLSSL